MRVNRSGIQLVVGADGLIGRALADGLASKEYHVLETTRRVDYLSENRIFLDLCGNSPKWLPPCPIFAAYLCAGVSSLESCRTKPAHTALVNVHNTVQLATLLAARGTFIVYPSSNLVHDGCLPFRKIDDPVCPQSEYGRQKAEVEKKLLALGERASIVRMTKVIGKDTPLLKGWIQKLRKGKEIHPFSDMAMAPVPLHSVINVLIGVVELRLSGIVQISGERDITYEEAARYIAWRLGVDANLVQPVSSKERGLPREAVPSSTTLDMTRLQKELGIEIPGVWQTLDTVFEP
ncbi:MAG: sugar nucleotide-binding protein [Pseudomonadota bacterium]